MTVLYRLNAKFSSCRKEPGQNQRDSNQINSSFVFRQISVQGDPFSGRPSHVFQIFWDLQCFLSVFPQSMFFSFFQLNFEPRYGPLNRFLHKHSFFYLNYVYSLSRVCIFSAISPLNHSLSFFLTLKHECVHQEVRNVRFSENSACFDSL